MGHIFGTPHAGIGLNLLGNTRELSDTAGLNRTRGRGRPRIIGAAEGTLEEEEPRIIQAARGREVTDLFAPLLQGGAAIRRIRGRGASLEPGQGQGFLGSIQAGANPEAFNKLLSSLVNGGGLRGR